MVYFPLPEPQWSSSPRASRRFPNDHEKVDARNLYNVQCSLTVSESRVRHTFECLNLILETEREREHHHVTMAFNVHRTIGKSEEKEWGRERTIALFHCMNLYSFQLKHASPSTRCATSYAFTPWKHKTCRRRECACVCGRNRRPSMSSREYLLFYTSTSHTSIVVLYTVLSLFSVHAWARFTLLFALVFQRWSRRQMIRTKRFSWKFFLLFSFSFVPFALCSIHPSESLFFLLKLHFNAQTVFTVHGQNKSKNPPITIVYKCNAFSRFD